jgi:Predicted transcriptional regulators
VDVQTQQWLHGFLDFCLLGLIDAQRDYGRSLAERLTQAGFGDIPGGTLYPALVRMERQGLIAASKEPSAVGPPRKYYETTAKGREAFRELVGTWERFKAAVEASVDGEGIPREVIARQTAIRRDKTISREEATGRGEQIGREGDWL